MSNYHHESEDLADLLDGILASRVLEEGNEDVFEPVGIESLFFKENLEDCEDAGVFELPEPAFHELKELLLHFAAENFPGPFVVSQKEVLDVGRVEFVEVLLNFGVKFFPEPLVLAVQLFHQVVKWHQL